MNPFVLVGALIGFAVGRWTGLFFGALIGYWISHTLRQQLMRTIQTRFLDSTFAVMGAVCKADGRVSENEVRVAEALFERLRLPPDARSSARAAFNRGKSPGFDLDAEVASFAKACRGQRVLYNMFLQVQLAAVSADGAVNAAEHQMLVRIARGLGLSEAEVQQLEAAMRVHGNSSKQKLDDAYEVMGVPPSASDADLKKAYRKLMSENHPDKLAARGLPESMRQMAEEKTRDITAAYDAIKEARGLA
ncbi:MAG: co-chaperone DjlA [Panacagrimonas sp.]